MPSEAATEVLDGLAGKLADWVDLHDAFKAMDENKDGTLSVAELKSGVGKLLEREVSESAIEEIFDIIDKDHDNKVSYSEFIALAESQHSPPASSSSFSFFRPTDGINYNFVAGMYAAASMICAILGALDKLVKIPQVEGYWMIFAPFLPCLVWSLAVRQQWLATREIPAAKKTN